MFLLPSPPPSSLSPWENTKLLLQSILGSAAPLPTFSGLTFVGRIHPTALFPTASWGLGDQKSSLSQLSPAWPSFVGEDSSHCASWATRWILLTIRMITVVIVKTLFQTDSSQCESWARDLPCDGDPNYTDDHTWTSSVWIMYISKYFIMYISPFRQQRNFVQLCTSKIITMISLLLLLMILFRLRMIMWWTLKKHAASRF